MVSLAQSNVDEETSGKDPFLSHSRSEEGLGKVDFRQAWCHGWSCSKPLLKG